MKQFIFMCVVLMLGLSSPAVATPVQWTAADGGNDHWYELVKPGTGKINWTTAKSLAEASTYLGQAGHLATITSTAEQSFVNGINAAFTTASRFHSGTYVRAWLGGTDVASEGTWEWTTGESFTHTNWTNWANTNGANKDYLAGWAWSNTDKWKDCRNNKRNCSIFRYVVEYDIAPESQITPVPLPATLPFIALGLGMLTFVGRRRKNS